jgi:hypothetical protein
LLSAQTKSEKKNEESNKQVHIEMKDGSSLDGKLVARRGDTIVIESSSLGMLNLNINNIHNINTISNQPTKIGTNWFDNVHAVHGFISPTGYNLRKGEGFYGNIYLFFNYVSYGFTDNFSISAGTEFISILFNENSGFPLFYYANPKFSFQADKNINIGLGTLLIMGRGIFDNASQIIPIPYGVATFGSRDNNFSAGLATSIVEGQTLPLLTLSAQGRLARGVSLMTENYLTTVGDNFGITGFRFMNKYFAFNVGGVYSLSSRSTGFSLGLGNGGSSENPFSLFLGINVPFGQRRK